MYSNYYGTDRHRCVRCRKLSFKCQRINGSAWHCFDGCYSTTGWDIRTVDGTPIWKGGKKVSFYNEVKTCTG